MLELECEDADARLSLDCLDAWYSSASQHKDTYHVIFHCSDMIRLTVDMQSLDIDLN